jgi:hypothetical protein
MKFSTALVLMSLVLLKASLGLAAENVSSGKNSDANSGITIESLLKKTKSEPKNALAYFNLGVLYKKAGQNELAIASFDKVVELKSSLAPAAIYYKALTQSQIGKKEDAKKTIQGVNLEGLPENLKSQVTGFKNELFAVAEPEKQEVEAEDKAFSFSVDLSGGYNSNPAATNSPLPPTTGSDSTFEEKAGLGYRISESKVHDLSLSYYFSNSSYSTDTGYNYFYHEVTLPFGYYFENYRLRITPEYFNDNFGAANFSQSLGGTLDFALHADDTYWGLSLRGASLANLTSSYYYLTGTETKFQLYYETSTEKMRFLVNFAYNSFAYQDTTTLASSYVAYPISISYSWYWPKFDCTASVSEESRTYAVASATSSVARQDTKYYESLHAGYTVMSETQIYLETTATQNSSNYSTSSTGNYNYSQFTAMLGATYFY